jgi:uncharacterized protein (DUF1800 family)
MRRRPPLALFSAFLPVVLLSPPAGQAARSIPDDATLVHVLNRLAYGPRPADVAEVRRIGVEAWTLRQLHPDRIPDDGLLARLARLDTSQFLTSLMDDADRRVVQDLQSVKLVRAVYSERQLEEVLVDFWVNHFNVFAGKGPVRFMLADYEKDVIRPHAWGRFEDLLRATARSPAMLFYLDNWLSSSPRAPARAGRRRGLNENYARELMELHTLGVDGGYTQKDVTEVARCFTGWTMTPPRQDDPRFVFRPRWHEGGDKVVLGQRIRSGGQDEGEQVLHLLANHPATARLVSRKLARRFVADEPPAALVERAATVFRDTRGDIRQVVRAIVTSPEFFAADARGVKVKTPLEFVASAVRASGADVSDARALARRLAQMGMPLYLQQPPTGYGDTAETWVSTSGLVARLNFALELAAGRLPGVTGMPAAPAATAEGEAVLDAMAARLLPAGLSPSTRSTVTAEGRTSDPARLAGLLLGSPEFQRR